MLRLFCSLLATALILLTTGCANFTTTAPSGVPEGEVSAVTGSVHGGQQPVAFATVQIWSAGTSGYGSAGTLFATTTTADDGAGSFSFNKKANTDTPYANTGNTWACPASTNPYMYLIASGGNTQNNHNASTVNTAAVFLVALGQCSTITSSTSIFLNEVTTVGSMAALTQYFSPVTETIGSPNTTQALQGLANAFNTVGVLISVSQGIARTTFGSNVYVEAPKINTIADVLAACMSTPSLPSANCTTLFTNATPPAPAVTSQPSATFNSATDTLQALWYMLANPTDGARPQLNNLYGLIAASGAPFQPTGYRPIDWNVGITYTSNPGVALGNCASGISYPAQVVINASGSPYVLSTGLDSGFTQLSAFGNVEVCVPIQSAQVVFDTHGDLWLPSNTSSLIYAYNQAGGLAETFQTPFGAPFGIAADGSGNIFYGGVAASGFGAIYEIPAANIPSSGSTTALPTSASVLLTPLQAGVGAMVADQSGNIWVESTQFPSGREELTINELTKSTGYSATQAVAPYGAYYEASLAVDAAGGVLFALFTNANSLAQIGSISGSPGLYSTSYYTSASLQGDIFAVDGAGNIWAAGDGYAIGSLSGVGSGYVTESTSSGTVLTVPGGINKPVSSSEASSTLVQNEVVLGPANSIAIDLSGNVYVSTYSTNMFNTTAGQQYTVTELVGAAVPVVTPLALAAANGAIGMKP